MNSNEIAIGDLRFSPDTGKLSLSDGAPVELRHKSKEVLTLLVASQGETVTKQAFFETLWTDVVVSDDSLAQCIADIRRHVGDDAKTIIKTVPREGYRLNSFALKASETQKRHRHVLASALVLVAGMIGLALWALLLPTEPRSGPPVVAVLPLDDLSLGENKGALGDMLSEGIITELARYPQINVIAKNSSFQFRSGEKNLDLIADVLSADYVLTGSQQFDGNAVRVTFQLVDTQTGILVFSDKFDRELGDIFSVQDEIVLQVAATAGQTVMRDIVRTRSLEDVSATILSLKAKEAIADKFSKSNFEIAYALETENVTKHPKSPWGHIGIALLLRGAANWGWLDDPADVILTRAKNHAEIALKIDPNNYMAHFARSRVHSQMGVLEEAIHRLEAAAALNPSASNILIAMATPLLYLGRDERAIEVLEQAKNVDPLHGNWLYWKQGWAYWHTGDCDKGVVAMNSMSHAPDTSKRMLAGLYACLGDKQKAQETLGQWLKERPGYNIEHEIKSTYNGLWKGDATRSRWIEDMRFAGMPEISE